MNPKKIGGYLGIVFGLILIQAMHWIAFLIIRAVAWWVFFEANPVMIERIAFVPVAVFWILGLKLQAELVSEHLDRVKWL